MSLKAKSVPVYCIESYPNSSQKRGVVHMSRLEDLVRDFKGIDQPHAHDFYMVMYVAEGSGSHTIDFKTYPIAPNQLYFLTPGQVHNWELSQDSKGFTLFFEAHFFTSMYNQRLYEYPFYHTLQHVPILQLEPDVDVFKSLFTCAFNEFQEAKSTHDTIILAYLYLLLEKANQFYKEEQVMDTNSHYTKIRHFEELVNQHFVTEREVRAYANWMNLSPNYLNAICKTYLNKTASQLIQERLLIEAQRLLTHTGMSIKEISYHLNFKDTSYFSRFFRKHTGQTPVAFKSK